jgi:polyisoprenyl-phosphate glycosyltransferase
MAETISVVVPVFNNEPTLAETCRQIIEVHESSFKDLDLELIFVNDGSSDESWQELLRLQHFYKQKITLLNLSRNFGQTAALFAGFQHATGDAIICISADLQDPIALMGKMVAHWKNNAEIVICYRRDRTDGFFARIFSTLAYSIARLSYKELPKGGFDYWLMSKRVCQLLGSLTGRSFLVQGYLSSLGFAKAFIPYTRVTRPVGRSGYSFWKKLEFVIQLIIDSYVPIRFMSCLGLFIATSGVVYSLVIVYAWFMNQTPFRGWVPLMIVAMIIGGGLMTMVGIIGEYVWRLYDDHRGLPRYIVETKSTSEAQKHRSVNAPGAHAGR